MLMLVVVGMFWDSSTCLGLVSITVYTGLALSLCRWCCVVWVGGLGWFIGFCIFCLVLVVSLCRLCRVCMWWF